MTYRWHCSVDIWVMVAVSLTVASTASTTESIRNTAAYKTLAEMVIDTLDDSGAAKHPGFEEKEAQRARRQMRLAQASKEGPHQGGRRCQPRVRRFSTSLDGAPCSPRPITGFLTERVMLLSYTPPPHVKNAGSSSRRRIRSSPRSPSCMGCTKSWRTQSCRRSVRSHLRSRRGSTRTRLRAYCGA